MLPLIAHSYGRWSDCKDCGCLFEHNPNGWGLEVPVATALQLIIVATQVSPTGDTILVVDDDADIRDAISLVLRSEGYSVIPAEDGQSALDVLGYGAVPRVILLDLMMPRLNGLEFLEHARDLLRDRDIRVVVVTANQGYAAEDLGVCAVLRKPMDAQDLIQAVEQAAA